MQIMNLPVVDFLNAPFSPNLSDEVTHNALARYILIQLFQVSTVINMGEYNHNHS